MLGCLIFYLPNLSQLWGCARDAPPRLRMPEQPGSSWINRHRERHARLRHVVPTAAQSPRKWTGDACCREVVDVDEPLEVLFGCIAEWSSRGVNGIGIDI